MLGRVSSGLGALLVVAGLGLGAIRVVALETDELEHIGDPVPLEPTPGEHGPEPHRELGRARVDAGEDVTFEVCAAEPFTDAWAGALAIAVWDPATQELVTRTEIDAERVRAARPVGSGECIVIARGTDLPAGGELAIEAVWDAELPAGIAGTPLRAHVIAHRPLASSDLWPVLLVLLGAFLSVMGNLGTGTTLPPRNLGTGTTLPPDRRGLRPLVHVAIGLVVLAAATIAAGMVPVFGASAGLGRGLFLAATQAVAAVLLVRAARPPDDALPAPRGRSLALVPPSRWWALALAPIAGIAVWAAGGVLLRVVPSTGEAAIESFVAWPSGMLAVSLAAVLVPLAEELFFRGFVYGTLDRRYGARTAFVATVLLFTAAHLPQAWHAWGAVSAILLTGVVLTALRAWTGSVLVPALAHLAYNGVNVVLSLATAYR